VSTEVYIKYCRILLGAIPIRAPMAEQTPKAFHSTKNFNLFIAKAPAKVVDSAFLNKLLLS
jgi:uncharacterized membrane protein